MICLSKVMPNPISIQRASLVLCTLFPKPLMGLKVRHSLPLQLQAVFFPIRSVAVNLEVIWSFKSSSKVKCANKWTSCPVLEIELFLGPNIQASFLQDYGLKYIKTIIKWAQKFKRNYPLVPLLTRQRREINPFNQLLRKECKLLTCFGVLKGSSTCMNT